MLSNSRQILMSKQTILNIWCPVEVMIPILILNLEDIVLTLSRCWFGSMFYEQKYWAWLKYNYKSFTNIIVYIDFKISRCKYLHSENSIWYGYFWLRYIWFWYNWMRYDLSMGFSIEYHLRKTFKISHSYVFRSIFSLLHNLLIIFS